MHNYALRNQYGAVLCFFFSDISCILLFLPRSQMRVLLSLRSTQHGAVWLRKAKTKIMLEKLNTASTFCNELHAPRDDKFLLSNNYMI